MSKVHIVTPIGVSSPGTPVQELLEKSVNNILAQTHKDFVLTIASDDNVPDRVKEFIAEKKLDVKWFDKHSFFRPGGIWKKVTDTWQEHDSEYIAFMHYDDLWDAKKMELQVEAMDAENLDVSWSESYVINSNDAPITGDCAGWEKFSSSTIGGRTTAFAHSVIVRRSAFFESGIMKYQEKWSGCFEELFTLFLQKYPNSRKVKGARFFWRNHEDNMSNTLCTWTQSNSLWKSTVEDQMSETDYSSDQTTEDHQFIMHDTIQFRKELQQLYNE